MMKKTGTALAALVLGVGTIIGISQLADAADLRIGRASAPQSIDPQFSRTGPNQMTAAHIFDRLLIRDEKGAFTPSLAESWKNIDPKTWEVKLRKGVKFHDGSPFSAEDVVFSLDRAPKVPKSPASFVAYVRNIKSIEIVDQHTLKITSKKPDPVFMLGLGSVFIVSKKAAEGATTADFNSGKAAIGTGPFKFKSWVPGDRLELTRNDAYWGKKPEFANVNVRFINNDAARVAALLSGAVDMIDLVPPADLPKLTADKNINVFRTASARLVYLALNQRKKVPGIAGVDGKPLKKNPLRDSRVRQAISMMIDRKGLVDRILYGQGEPTLNIVPDGMLGHNKDLKPKYDPSEAKKLLADAGYPKGFAMPVFGSNNRLLLDSEVTQALGQLFARGGIKVTKVETLPYSVYSKNAKKGIYSAYIFSNGNSSGEAGRALEGMLRTYNKKKKQGSLNRHRYTNASLDKLIGPALSEFDPTKRWKMQAEAVAVGAKDGGIIPLYHQAVAWAMRKGFSYTARRDEHTLAMGVSLAK